MRHGVIAPLDQVDFKDRNWVPDSGWPISYDDLHPYYVIASEFLGSNCYKFFDKRKLHLFLKSLLQVISFNEKCIENKLFQRPLPVMRLSNSLLDQFSKSGSGLLVYNICALEIITNEEKVAAEIKCGIQGVGLKSVFANQFIVCTGALETPRLLLNSGFSNRNIGRYLMDHPMASVGQVEFVKAQATKIYAYTRYKKNLMLKSGFKLTEQFQREHRLLNHCFYLKNAYSKYINRNSDKLLASLISFRDGGITLMDFWNILRNPSLVLFMMLYKITSKTKYADIFIVSEQSPKYESQVSLSMQTDQFGFRTAEINWLLAESDIEDIHRMVELAQKHFFKEENVKFVEVTQPAEIRGALTSAAHHLGTARMSIAEDSGVVDTNLKMHGIKNVYICDGSVFPTAGNANSTLTIVALAFRLAKHLVNSPKLKTI